MNPFFIYLIKSTLSISVLYILFWLAMRHDKTHAINRFLLLGILVFSATIPLLDFQFFYKEIPLKQVEVFREFISAPIVSPVGSIPENNADVVSNEITYNPFLVFYIVIIVALLVRLSLSLISVMRIIQGAERRNIRKIMLAVVKDLIHPFSFFNRIVLSEKDFNENKEIVITHEYEHIKQFHAIDLVVCELFTLIHFFNPFIWLLRRDLKLIHEYQADQAVMNNAIESKKYQLLILEKAVGERRFAMANRFTQKPILKRIKMMHKKSNKPKSQIKLILFVPILVLLLQAFARPELIKSTEEFIPVRYSGDETEKWLSKWTMDNIGNGVFEPGMISVNYPKKQNNILVIFINKNDDFMMDGKRIEGNEVKKITKNYLIGVTAGNVPRPDFVEKEIPDLGKVGIPKGTVYFKFDIASSKETINNTLRQIGEAFLEARKEKAKVLFGEEYFSLDDQKRDAVDMAVPIWFQVGEPKGNGMPNPDSLNYNSQKYESNLVEIYLTKDGKIFVWTHEYSINELESELIKENETLWKPDKNGVRYYLRSKLVIDDGASEELVNSVKEVVRNINLRNGEKLGGFYRILYGYDKSDYFKIGDKNYSIGNVLLGNESYQNNGKFEIDISTQENDQDVSIYLASLKSDSLMSPAKGNYIYNPASYNSRGAYTWWGKVVRENKEYEISSGQIEIIENTINDFVLTFNMKLKNGETIKGQYYGSVDYKDWRR